MARRIATNFLPAVLVALVINVFIFGLASVLSQDRDLQEDIMENAGVKLVNLDIPEPPEPEKVKEQEKPKPKDKLDFAPDLVKPPLLNQGAFDIGGLAINVGGVGSGSEVGEEIIFNAYELDQEPQPVVRVPPIYPYKAREQGIEGKVLIKLLVNADGTVGQVIIMDARPKGIFENAVMKSVPSWKFNPGKVDGEPVTAWVVTTVNFDLN